MLDIEDYSDEEDFIELVDSGFSKVVFLDMADKIIGSDWQEVGREWVESMDDPELMKKFESYI